MTRKLYEVRTVAPEFKGHRNVTIHWFVDRRTTRVKRPYAELIAGYDRAEKIDPIGWHGERPVGAGQNNSSRTGPRGARPCWGLIPKFVK